MADEEDKSIHEEINHNKVEENDVATDASVEKGIRTLLILILPAASSPFVGYREKSPTSGTREKTREWHVLARLILLDTRDGELACGLKGRLSNEDGNGS